jgi:hypothetical protein
LKERNGDKEKVHTSFIVLERLVEREHDLAPESDVGNGSVDVRLEKFLSVVEDDGSVGRHDRLESLKETLHDREKNRSAGDQVGFGFGWRTASKDKQVSSRPDTAGMMGVRRTGSLIHKLNGSPVIDSDKEGSESSLAKLDDDLHERTDRLGLDRVDLLQDRECEASDNAWNKRERREESIAHLDSQVRSQSPSQVKGGKEESEGALKLGAHSLPVGVPQDPSKEVEERRDGHGRGFVDLLPERKDGWEGVLGREFLCDDSEQALDGTVRPFRLEESTVEDR